MIRSVLGSCWRQTCVGKPFLSCTTGGSRRWHWQVILERQFDIKSGQYKYPDWDTLAYGIQEPMKTSATTGTTISLLNRSLQRKEHVKPKERRRRINANKVYRRSVDRLNNLIKYIKFVRGDNNVLKDENPAIKSDERRRGRY